MFSVVFKGLLLGAAMYLVLIYTMDGLSSPSPSVSYVAPATTTATESPTEEVQLPRGMTVDETCAALQTRIDNAAQHDNLHQKSVLYYWNKLDCDNKMKNPATNERHKMLRNFLKQHKIPDKYAPSDSNDRPSSVSHSPTESANEEEVVGGEESMTSVNSMRCHEMRDQYHVVPGSSWGTLPLGLQKEWSQLECDTIIVVEESKARKRAAELEEERADSSPSSNILKNIFASKVDSQVEKKESTPGEIAVDKDKAAWCLEMKEKYSVQPLKSWGNLPTNLIKAWGERNCDKVFTALRMRAKPLSVCPEQNIKNSNKLPLISIMAATTTRKVSNPSPKNMALFIYMLPSLIRTVDCGFRYEYVLGYDKGDQFYDTDEGKKMTEEWFKTHVQSPMEKNGISITLKLCKVNNTLKKPGPVFIEMARMAYKGGAEYFYRINDDTELVENWPILFVKGIKSLSLPYGVVGPRCNQGNTKILTHDFVHRTHMEVFDMNYYPVELTDWWMDDWISLVYGKERTFKARDATVIHHTGAHGQRYEVDKTHEQLLMKLVVAGRTKIRQWMLSHQVPEAELKAFDADVFHRDFLHHDVPK